MAWNHMPQAQQRGSQLNRGRDGKGEPPREAIAGRGAQKNDEADQQLTGAPAQGALPAETIENSGRDNVPTAPEASVAWDEVVQPEPSRDSDDGEPLPDGK